MPRGPRLLPEGGTFHIFIRGNNKRCVFRRDCEFRYFKKLIIRYKRRFGFFLYHYILMKNHIHFCIKAFKKTDISKMMQGLELAYSHYQRKKRGYVGHLWQGRFKSNIIADDNYLLGVGLYIERNPVEAGIVKDPAEYKWSSYRYYSIGEKDPLVDPNPLYEELGRNTDERQAEYKKLIFSQIKELGYRKEFEKVFRESG